MVIVQFLFLYHFVVPYTLTVNFIGKKNHYATHQFFIELLNPLFPFTAWCNVLKRWNQQFRRSWQELVVLSWVASASANPSWQGLKKIHVLSSTMSPVRRGFRPPSSSGPLSLRASPGQWTWSMTALPGYAGVILLHYHPDNVSILHQCVVHRLLCLWQ